MGGSVGNLNVNVVREFDTQFKPTLPPFFRNWMPK
jgi:hypothetical protein